MNVLKKCLIIILCITTIISFSSCNVKENTSESETVIFTDDIGREVEIPSTIKAVLPASSNSQMYLTAICSDLLVGLSGEINDIEIKYLDNSLVDLPISGSLYGKGDINAEEVAKINPDIIIDLGDNKSDLRESLDEITNKTGIPVIHMSASLETTGEAFRKLGKLLGREEKGETLGTYCDEAYATLSELGNSITNKKRTVYLDGDDGLSVVSKDSFHSEILDTICDNVAVLETPTKKGSGSEINMEELLNWNPDYIIFAPNSICDKVKDKDIWNNINAIKNGNYYKTPFGPYNFLGYPPAVNRFLGIYWLSNTLYPNECKFNLEEKIIEYYKLFYSYELSKDEYNKIINEN